MSSRLWSIRPGTSKWVNHRRPCSSNWAKRWWLLDLFLNVFNIQNSYSYIIHIISMCVCVTMCYSIIFLLLDVIHINPQSSPPGRIRSCSRPCARREEELHGHRFVAKHGHDWFRFHLSTESNESFIKISATQNQAKHKVKSIQKHLCCCVFFLCNTEMNKILASMGYTTNLNWYVAHFSPFSWHLRRSCLYPAKNESDCPKPPLGP